jgi:hypothetical protein
MNNVLLAVTANSPADAWAVGWHQDASIPQRTRRRSLVYEPRSRCGFCGHILNRVTGIKGTDDVWAVGTVTGLKGQLCRSWTLIEHKHNGVWVREASGNLYNLQGTDNALNAVSASNAKDVWAVRCVYPVSRVPRMLILHWKGSYWEPSSIGQGCLHAVKALSSEDVWAVGESANGASLVVHRTATGWHVIPSP